MMGVLNQIRKLSSFKILPPRRTVLLTPFYISRLLTLKIDPGWTVMTFY